MTSKKPTVAPEPLISVSTVVSLRDYRRIVQARHKNTASVSPLFSLPITSLRPRVTSNSVRRIAEVIDLASRRHARVDAADAGNVVDTTPLFDLD